METPVKSKKKYSYPEYEKERYMNMTRDSNAMRYVRYLNKTGKTPGFATMQAYMLFKDAEDKWQIPEAVLEALKTVPIVRRVKKDDKTIEECSAELKGIYWDIKHPVEA